MTEIKKINQKDRPREKMKLKGPEALSDLELLQALIGSGNKRSDVTKISKDTLSLFKKNGAQISYVQLEKITGLGKAKITEILAAIELSKRYLLQSELPIIDTPQKAFEQLDDIRNKKQEYFVCMTLDGANRLISKRIITIGTLTSSLVHPREVFADAITDRAASIIVAHNHPSGNLFASNEDDEITEKLLDVGIILGISLKDHILITPNSYTSIML